MPDVPTPHQPTRPTSGRKPEDTRPHPDDTASPAGAPGADPDLRPGARPVPEHTLVARLGKGSFGEVWRARDDNGKDVALKFLRYDPHADTGEVRELDVMKNVGHAHLLVLHRYWRLGGWLVVALELAQGTLQDRLREANQQGQAGIPLRELLEFFREAAKGLDYLHSLGIQHRDVKPANLLLVGGTVKVADFGLAKLLESSVATNTNRHMAGTPAFAAPETWEGKTSAHSDQYALAVSWCQLRAGRLPFEGSLMALAFAHCHKDPDLSMLPAAERAAVTRALAKKPGVRWPSFRDFVAALIRCYARRPAPDPKPVPPPPRPPRRLWPYALAGALVLLVAVATVPLIPRGADPKARPEIRERPPPLDCTGPGGVSVADVRQAQEAWAEYLGREVVETVDIADGELMTFVLVPPGRFRMGSPDGEMDRDKDEALHRVVLTEPFDLGMYEVVQQQYQALIGKNPSHFQGPDLPVEQVSWEEAAGYGTKLTEKLKDRHVYRLPTEAEWEYACRGGRPSVQPFGIGRGWSLSSREANFDGNFPYGGADKGPFLQKTCAAGSYKANALGLFDMHGNAWEWCSDGYGRYPDGEVTNPTGPTEGPLRVIRGGGWHLPGGRCRAAIRHGYDPGYRHSSLGFRLARSVPSGGK